MELLRIYHERKSFTSSKIYLKKLQNKKFSELIYDRTFFSFFQLDEQNLWTEISFNIK